MTKTHSAKLSCAVMCSVMFRNAYFLDSMTPSPHPNIPPYLHMLQHVVSRNSYNIINCLLLYYTELYRNVSVLPSWKLSGVGILANKARGPRAGGPRAEGFISQYSHPTQFPTG